MPDHHRAAPVPRGPVSPEQIEAAARAIWSAFQRRTVRGLADDDWAKVKPVLKEQYRDEARAALAAAAAIGRL